MTEPVFDVALLKRFTDTADMALVNVSANDSLIILNSETGELFRIQISTLTSSVNGSLSASDIRSKLGITVLSGSNTGDETQATILSKLGYTPENPANKGQANGYAGLDGSGKVPSSQLPSFVDDVLEYANIGSFPATGESGKIYVSLATNLTYRWSGSAYTEISASPGSTDAVPEGASNLYFTNARARSAVSASGSLSYNPTTGVFSFTDAVTSVAGKTGAVTLASGDVGLGNVTNDAQLKAGSNLADLPNVVTARSNLGVGAQTEGFWTPQYGTTGTDFSAITYETTFTKGTYVKIGSLVFICGYIRTESLTPGSASGNIVLKNLPFPVYNPSPGTAARAALMVGSVSGFTNAPIRGLIDYNSSAIYLIKAAEAYMVPSDLATGSNANILVFSAIYKTSS